MYRIKENSLLIATSLTKTQVVQWIDDHPDIPLGNLSVERYDVPTGLWDQMKAFNFLVRTA